MKLLGSISKYLWFVKNTFYIIGYAVLALFLYDIIAEITLEGSPITGLGPITLATPLDAIIPFLSAFTVFYVFIFYPFVIYSLGYLMYIRPEKADKVFLSILIVYIVAFLNYLLLPVKMIRPDPDKLPSDFLSRVMAKYYKEDLPVNCFPSLHAANSTLFAYWMSKAKPRFKILFWAIAISVIISTLFVRQHVMADEVYGFLLAYLVSWLIDRGFPDGKPVKEYWLPRAIFTLVLATAVAIFIILGYLP